jgi:sugar phosphate isomerase/epimerase
MKLCIDATRFGFGLIEAVELAAMKGAQAVEYTFDPFAASAKGGTTLSSQEKSYLQQVRTQCRRLEVEIACLRLNTWLNTGDKNAVKHFQQMAKKLGRVAEAAGCSRLVCSLQPMSENNWIEQAAFALTPVIDDLSKHNVKLLLSLSTPQVNLGQPLRNWRPMEPHEVRNLLCLLPGLSLSFSAADLAWQNIDYLQLLPQFVAAVEHVEANDVEINRAMLADSGLFGPLWWRYRMVGKGQIDWRQLVEALKLYDYQGTLSIHIEDEFAGESIQDLEDSLESSVKFLRPLLKY